MNAREVFAEGWRQGFADHVPWREQPPGRRALAVAAVVGILAGVILAWLLLSARGGIVRVRLADPHAAAVAEFRRSLHDWSR